MRYLFHKGIHDERVEQTRFGKAEIEQGLALEGQHPPGYPHYRHQLQVRESPKIICYKDSQNSLKTLILKVMVYYSERIQIKISKSKRHVKQGPG